MMAAARLADARQPATRPRVMTVPGSGLTFDLPRLRAARGLPFTIRLAVTPDADWLYGVNISNWPEGYDSHDATPLEVEID